QVPAAAEGTVPDLPALQQQIAALNTQTADRAVVPILKAGPAPGTVDLALRVDDHLPFHGSVELNNEYTQDTSSLRAAFSLSYANLFGELDDVGLQYQMSPQHTGQVGVFGATYTSRPLIGGLRISGFYIDSSSNVATVGALGILGKGQIYGTRFTF